jgi:hypothetical protein
MELAGGRVDLQPFSLAAPVLPLTGCAASKDAALPTVVCLSTGLGARTSAVRRRAWSRARSVGEAVSFVSV